MIVFHSMSICNVVSPSIVPLYTQFEVDIEQLPVKHIWTELMGIILAANVCLVPFLKKFGVEKGNGISHFDVSIDIPHALGELVKEYFKIPTPERRVNSTRTVDEDENDVEEVGNDGPSVDNGAYNTAGLVENHFQKIKKYEVDINLNTIYNNAVEEDTVNEKTQESSKGINYYISIDNGVDGSVVYYQ